MIMRTNVLKLNSVILMIGLLVMSNTGLKSQMLEVNPLHAGFVWETHPDSSNFNVNAGNNSDMNVQYSPDDADSREAYLKFDISEMKQIATSVTLYLTAGQKGGTEETYGDKEWVKTEHFYIEVYGTTEEWSADTLTWNQKPASEGYPLATFDVLPDSWARYEMEGDKILNYINGVKTNGATEVTFILKAKDPYTNSRAWVTNGMGWEAQTPVLEIDSKDIDVTVEAAKDIWVDEAAPEVNRNGVWDMGVLNAEGKSRHTYIAFDKGDLPDFATDVYLQLFGKQKHDKDGWDDFVYQTQPDFIVEVYGCYNNNWDETTLTWDTENRPQSTRLPLAEINVNNISTWYTAADERLINYFNRTMADPGKSQISFILKAKEENASSRVWFAENVWKGHAAKLSASGMQRGGSVGSSEATFVDEAFPYNNFNDQRDMHVALANGKHRVTYLKYDLAGQSEANEVIMTIVGGQQGNGYMVQDHFMVDVYACEEKAWAEAQVVWATAPDITGDALATVDFVDGNRQLAVSVEFTAYINSKISSGAQEITLALKAQNESFSETDSLRAWVYDGNHPTSLDFLYAVSSSIAAPVFDPAPGVQTENFSITMTTETEGADIYYTLDGSAPTQESTKYTAPVNMTVEMGNVTLRAVTIKDGARSAESRGDFLVGIQKPYDGEPVELPAIVYATKFDVGGPTVSYYTTNTSFPNWAELHECRTDNAQIVGDTEDCNFEIGAIAAPSPYQWMEYTIKVPTDITCYKAKVFYRKAEESTGQDPASLRIQIVDNNDIVTHTLIDSVEFEPNIPAWDYDGDGDPKLIESSFTLPAGEQVLRLTILGHDWNLERIDFVPSTACGSSIITEKDAIEDIIVYPNPVTNGVLNLHRNKIQNTAIQISVFDIHGKRIFEKTVTNHDKNLRIPVENVTKGMYFLKIWGNNKTQVQKIVIE
jgi:hypothetical protein